MNRCVSDKKLDILTSEAYLRPESGGCHSSLRGRYHSATARRRGVVSISLDVCVSKSEGNGSFFDVK